MGRVENVAVFNDTAKLCRENEVIKEALKASVLGQKLIREGTSLPAEKIQKEKYADKAQIIVSKKKSFETAAGYRKEKVCVLNFASATNPGGGVELGASAQEECLCRCSGLYFALNTEEMWEGFYAPHRRERNPLHNDDIIYTPDILVFKSDYAIQELLPKQEWYQVNVITCAAPNLRGNPSNRYNSGDGNQAVKITEEELFALHVKRFTAILDVAAAEGNEVVILGAFGCGAFANSPNVVARAAKQVIANYMHCFKTIEFAVYSSSWDAPNYRIFDEVLGL